MPKPTPEKLHLVDKRNEIVWALHYQGYNGEEIGFMFNINRSSVKYIIAKMPRGWQPKWRKVELEPVNVAANAK